jgi:hypothetical protein
MTSHSIAMRAVDFETNDSESFRDARCVTLRGYLPSLEMLLVSREILRLALL